jgi:hypothetical protein
MNRRIPAAVAIGGAFAAALIAGPTAQAAPTDGASQPVVHAAATTRTAQQRVSSYWTAGRMRAAEPRRVPAGADQRSGSVRTGAPAVVRSQALRTTSATAAHLGSAWTGGGKVARTTGKVFFTEHGVDYVCSGSVVAAANKSTVLTAGHCVNEGPGAYMHNFVFVPGYKHGSAPYGVWSAKALITTKQWRTHGNVNYDVGFAVVGKRHGRYLSSVVGSQSIGFNQPRRHFLYAFGYPEASPYNGERLDYCSDTATRDRIGGTNDQRLDCNMTGGASGGPWLDKFSKSSGTGLVVSVNSFGYDKDRHGMYGPYFGKAVHNTYRRAQSAA